MMAVSYSQYAKFRKCGAAFKYRYIDKLPEEKSSAMSRGTELHGAVENFLLGRIDALPTELDFYTQWLTSLKQISGIEPEKKIAVLPNWEVTDWEDKDAMLRAVIDLYVPPVEKKLINFEFKTGKIYTDHADQRSLYSLLGFVLHPEVEEVELIGVYLDSRKQVKSSFVKKMVASMKAGWEYSFKMMQDPAQYIPNPTYACRYCAFSKFKGGPCPF